MIELCTILSNPSRATSNWAMRVLMQCRPQWPRHPLLGTRPLWCRQCFTRQMTPRQLRLILRRSGNSWDTASLITKSPQFKRSSGLLKPTVKPSIVSMLMVMRCTLRLSNAQTTPLLYLLVLSRPNPQTSTISLKPQAMEISTRMVILRWYLKRRAERTIHLGWSIESRSSSNTILLQRRSSAGMLSPVMVMGNRCRWTEITRSSTCSQTKSLG